MTVECHELLTWISDARGEGRIICVDFDVKLPVERLALRVGLSIRCGNLRECRYEEARYIGGRVISHGLVDDIRLVRQDEAEALGQLFLDLFPRGRAHYWTNGEFCFIGRDSYLGRLQQVTPERSSCGVLVVSEWRSGVLWVADESPGGGAG